jgi:hypothetical protein
MQTHERFLDAEMVEKHPAVPRVLGGHQIGGL